MIDSINSCDQQQNANGPHLSPEEHRSPYNKQAW